ncbi:MAG: hypothetical protein ACRC2H_03085 [Silanimonas sp.]
MQGARIMAVAPDVEQHDVEPCAARACSVHEGCGTLPSPIANTPMALSIPRSRCPFWPAVTFAALASSLTGCAPEDIVPTEPMALDGTSLIIEPLPQQACDPGQPYKVRVRWAVTDWDNPKFDFHVGSSQGQLWARENDAEGEKVSDPFVTPGMWFVMVDRNSRLVVAATPAPALICPEPEADVAPTPASDG